MTNRVLLCIQAVPNLQWLNLYSFLFPDCVKSDMHSVETIL